MKKRVRILLGGMLLASSMLMVGVPAASACGTLNPTNCEPALAPQCITDGDGVPLADEHETCFEVLP